MSSWRLALALAAAICPPAAAAPIPFSPLDPAAFQSFLVNWQPDTRPLCALIRSDADWRRLFHPAPVMGTHRPFAPAATFWRGHAVLVIARIVPAPGRAGIFQATRLATRRDALELSYAFRPPPPASSTVKAWLGLAIPRALPDSVVFVENGNRVCDVDAGRGSWVTPKPPAAP